MYGTLNQQQLQWLAANNPQMLQEYQKYQKIAAVERIAADLLTGGCSIF